ncbi:MAG TPA: 3-carboxy-cis,cis-muconate cycloisomerase [Candidatus Binataceae bacterium]|nr:3-carboxy-cis,cis-muconate cycloisomerase [Candidatus Binataceae bacterium]
MPMSIADFALQRDAFSSAAMRHVFCDESRLQRYLDFESALARVQARLAMIPAPAAVEIGRNARVAILDLDALRARTELVGSPVVPIVEQLAANCAGDLGNWCHWGATTQDVTDTATVMQMRDALALIEDDLAAIADTLAGLAQRWRDTPMAGRTNLQQAVPITFGFKAAGYLAAIERHRVRLGELRPRVLVGQFGGAAGTLAALGTRGLEVQAALMDELGLGAPEIAWHTHRDRVAEVGGWLALVTGTLGKIATDIKLMMQTEVGEAFEPFAAGRGSSSTMPQKRNPVACTYILACAAMVRQQAAALFDAMVEDHERASGAWQIEWVAVPEIFMISAGALAHSRALLAGLEIDPLRMRANLDLSGGLMLAEAVMMALATPLGRQHAHDLVQTLGRRAGVASRPFIDLLAADPEVAAHLDRPALARLLDPANYLGLAGAMVDRVLARRPPR